MLEVEPFAEHRFQRIEVGDVWIPAGQTDLVARGAGHDPGDVAGRQLRIQKNVEPIVVDSSQAEALRLEAYQEFGIGGEAAVDGHG